MGWPIHPEDRLESQESEASFLSHLKRREGVIGAIIVGGVILIAVILASILFPKMWLLAAMFFFAYMILFTLPMWVGLFEDDIEEETKRHHEPPAHD